MKRSDSGKNPWADHYTRKARKEDFAARSVYKLKEIQERFNLLAKGQNVLDLGCAPGSWLQYTAQLVGPRGRVVGVDLQPVAIALPPQVTVFTGDILDPQGAFRSALSGWGDDGFDVVISDMAPATTGIRDVDAARSVSLSREALALALTCLKPGGNFVCKIFQGDDFDPFVKRIKETFQKHKNFRPQSTRKASREIYVIGRGRK